MDVIGLRGDDVTTRHRPVEHAVTGGGPVVLLPVVGAAEGQNLLLAEVRAGVEIACLGIEKVEIEARHEARGLAARRVAQPLEDAAPVLEVVVEEVAADVEAVVTPDRILRRRAEQERVRAVIQGVE